MEDCLQCRANNKRNIFPPFGNELLPPSRDFTLKVCPIIYTLKKKHLCDYNPRFIMSSGLMSDEIIMNIIRSNKLECHDEEDDCFFTNIGKIAFICIGGDFKTFTGIKAHTCA